MKPPKKALRATSLDTNQLQQASGGRGTLCGVQMHCSGCGFGWMADANGNFGSACPNCGLGVDADPSGGGGGGGGGGGCGDREYLCCC